MSAQSELQQPTSVTAQAPAMVALTTKLAAPTDHGHLPRVDLKLGISRYDIATIQPREDKEILVSFEDIFETPIEYDDIPHDDLVAIFHAVDEMRMYLSRTKQSSGVDITIQKNIPFHAHLGGLAASTAAVLVALTKLWDAKIAREDLIALAHRVEPSVAEALTGGAMIIQHHSTEQFITPVLGEGPIALVVVPAAADITEHEMKSELLQLRGQPDSTEDQGVELDAQLLQAVSRGEAEQLARMMHNDFQPALVNLLPDHHDWLTAGMDEGALAAQTIGAGASLVFIARDAAHASELAERFEDRMGIAAVTEYGPVTGAQLVS